MEAGVRAPKFRVRFIAGTVFLLPDQCIVKIGWAWSDSASFKSVEYFGPETTTLPAVTTFLWVASPTI